MPPERELSVTRFDELHTLLEVAQSLVTDLTSDPILHRLLQAFLLLPPADREPILTVLEKDAAWRRIVEQTEGATGIDVRPNPNASLYLHVVVPTDGPPLDQNCIERDRDVIRFGLNTFVELLPLMFQDGVYAQWKLAAQEIVATADDELVRSARRMCREVLALLDEAAPTDDA